MRRVGLEPDARGAGKFVKLCLRPKKPKKPSPVDHVFLAHWAAVCAGHWGRLALGQEILK